MSLSELSALPGVSGDEHEVRAFIANAIRDHVDRMWVDSMGNLFAIKGEQLPGPRMMLCAHMDEVGLIVNHIDDDGTLKFAAVGGIDSRVLPGVWLKVGPDRLPGVIGTKPPHVKSRAEREKPVDSDSLYIDIGASSADEAKERVHLGAYASFWTDFELFGDGCAKGKAFDDRVGCHIVIETLRQPVRQPVLAAFTVQEELGLRGAQVAAYTLKPDAALVLEGTTCADIPLAEPHGQSTRLGDGPALTIADRSAIAHPGLLRTLVNVAQEAGIPHQFKRTTFGGTDAGAIQKSEAGVPVAVIAVPCRYIHSPVSMLNLADVQAAIQLVHAFLQAIPTEGDPPWMR